MQSLQTTTTIIEKHIKKYKLTITKKNPFTTSQVENKQHHGFKNNITILLKMPD